MEKTFCGGDCGEVGIAVGCRYILCREVSFLADEALSRGGTWDGADESDIVVALVRSAIIIAITMLPFFGVLRQTPLEMRIALILGAAYTLALFVARLAERWLPWQRPLAIVVDLYLITAAVITWGGETRALFQLYYIVVIVAAMWFGQRGAVITALLALYAFIFAEEVAAEWQLGTAEVVWLLWFNGAPVLLILALVASYVLRARERERARRLRLDHELRLARTMQQQMLPDALPELAGYELAVRLEVARVVSGDLYGTMSVSGDRLVMWVADVAGKGVYGMMHVSMMQSHLRAAGREGLSPAAIAERVNRGVYDAMQPSSFASVFIVQLHAPSGRLTYTNCGHPYPLLLPDGDPDSAVRLNTNTPLVGVTTTPGYLQLSTQLAPGDVLVMTTDGVHEARGRDANMFGEEGLLGALRTTRGASAAEIAAEIIRAIRVHSHGELADDAVVAVLRRSEG